MVHQSCSPFLLVCRSFGRTLWAAESPQSLKQASYIANLLLGLARTLIFMCQTHVMHIGLPMSSKIFRAIVFSACCRCSKITKPYPQDRLVIVFLHTLTEQIGLNGWNSLCNNCSVTSGCKSLTSNDDQWSFGSWLRSPEVQLQDVAIFDCPFKNMLNKTLFVQSTDAVQN